MGKTNIIYLKELVQKIINLSEKKYSDKFLSLVKIFYRKKRITLAIGTIAFTFFLCCCFLLKSLYAVGITKTSVGITLWNQIPRDDRTISMEDSFYSFSMEDASYSLNETYFRVVFHGNGKDELIVYSKIPKVEEDEQGKITRKFSITTSKNLHLRKDELIDGRAPTRIKYDFTERFENHNSHWFDLKDSRSYLICTFEGNIFGTRRDEHQMELYLGDLVSFGNGMKFNFPFSLSIAIPAGVDPKFVPNDGMEKSSTQSYFLYTSGSFPLGSPLSYPPYVYVSWADKIEQEKVKSQLYILGVIISITLSFLVKIILDFVSFCEEEFFVED